MLKERNRKGKNAREKKIRSEGDLVVVNHLKVKEESLKVMRLFHPTRSRRLIQKTWLRKVELRRVKFWIQKKKLKKDQRKI